MNICENIKCEKEHDETFGSGRFCCRSCANSRNWTKEDKRIKSIAAKNSKKVQKANKSKKKKKKLSKKAITQWKNGNGVYKHLHTKQVQKKINKTRRKNAKRKLNSLDKSKENEYRKLCKFNFNLSDYPNEFNFDLVKEHGWYKPKNKGDNLYGVSRDHIYSVKKGFENNINPELIRHPANCKLMIHSNNVSKGTECNITIKELKEKIIYWDKKYGLIV